MQFSSVDKMVIDLLLRRQSIEAYQLHQELGFSASQIARSIEKLTLVKIVRYSGDETMILSLHELSVPTIFKLRNHIYNRARSWRELPYLFDKTDRKKLKNNGVQNDRLHDFERLGSDLRNKIFEEVEKQVRKRES